MAEPVPIKPLPLPWLCCVSPVLLLLTLITMAVHIRLGLGHWPKPMVEDYHSPLFQLNEMELIAAGGFTLYVAGPLWLFCLCFRRWRQSWRVHLAQVGAYALGWALIFLAGYLDPTTFTDWFLD